MIELYNEYPIVLKQDVIWGDMDSYGHVNNTVYFRYFEDVRLACFDRVGVNAHMSEHQIGPILASTSCDFKLPLVYPDTIHIACRCTILGPRKIAMYYAVYSEHLEAIAAQGEGLVIYYDYNKNRSCQIPEAIEREISAL